MPMIDADGCPLNVEVEGREGAPVLMLSNSLGTDLHMWDDQAPEFAKHFRLVRWDRRGHGKSGTSKGPYSFDLFGRDILKIMDALKIKKMNWCGLSMGGMDGPETADYVSHHLKLAGRADTLFSDDALALIHQVSRGLPRAVNNLAVQSLVAAFAESKAIVDESSARAAVTEVTAE